MFFIKRGPSSWAQTCAGHSLVSGTQLDSSCLLFLSQPALGSQQPVQPYPADLGSIIQWLNHKRKPVLEKSRIRGKERIFLLSS